MASHARGVAAAALLLGAGLMQPASAHHVMDGALPVTAWQGLLSGLGHPVIGLDHLAFVVGVGLIAHAVGRILLLPLVFVAGTALGCWVHIAGYTVAWSEAAIALSAVIAAAVLAVRARIPAGALAALLLAAGAVHGYAYGESIVGAEPAPLAAYVAGFAIVQYAIAVASAAALRRLVAGNLLSEEAAARTAAAANALVGMLAFGNVLLG